MPTSNSINQTDNKRCRTKFYTGYYKQTYALYRKLSIKENISKNRNLKVKYPPVFGSFTTKAKAGGCFLQIAPIRVSGVSAPVPFNPILFERCRVSPQITILAVFLIAISFILRITSISDSIQVINFCDSFFPIIYFFTDNSIYSKMDKNFY